MNRGTLSVVLGGVVCLFPFRSAESQPLAPSFAVNLEYKAAPTCPDASAFRAAVIAKVGYDPFSEAAADHVLVLATARGNAWNGRLEWRDAQGEWTGEQTFPLVGTDCSRLVRGMSLALAVQIQLLAKTNALSEAGGAASTPAEPLPQASPAVEVSPTETSTPSLIARPPASPPAHRSRPVFAMGGGPSIGFGMSAALVLLGRLFASVTWRRFSVELAAAVSTPDTTSRPDGAGFSQRQLFLSAAGCAVFAPWIACVLANAGAVRMAGEHIDLPSSATVPFVEAGARIGFIQPFGHHAFVQAHLDGLTNLTRWTGELDQVPVWTAPRFATALGIDAGVRFP